MSSLLPSVADFFSVRSKESKRNQLSIESSGTSLEEKTMLATLDVSPTARFRTIQGAANAARPGDTVRIAPGTYRETVTVRTNGVTFRGANASRPPLLTTTNRLTNWTRDRGDVWFATLRGTSNPLQNRHTLNVFENGVRLSEGRLKNNADILNSDTWNRFESSNRNTITDNNPSRRFNNSLIGATVSVRINKFDIDVRRITGIRNNGRTLVVNRNFRRTPERNNPYKIQGARSITDSPGEWFFDGRRNRLFVRVANGVNPNNRTIEVTQRRDAINTAGRDNLRFINLSFRGGDIEARGTDNSLFDGLTVRSSNRNLGSGFGTVVQGLNLTGNNNRVINSSFAFTFSYAVRLDGSNNRVANNRFNFTGLNGLSPAILLGDNARNSSITLNTFLRTGRSHITGRGRRTLIERNSFTTAALTTEDTGAIYFWNNNFGNTVIRTNRITNARGDNVAGIYLDNNATNLFVHNNIVTNSTQGLVLNTGVANADVFDNTFSSRIGSGVGIGDGVDANGQRNFRNVTIRNNRTPGLASNFTGSGTAIRPRLTGNGPNGRGAGTIRGQVGDSGRITRAQATYNYDTARYQF